MSPHKRPLFPQPFSLREKGDLPIFRPLRLFTKYRSCPTIKFQYSHYFRAQFDLTAINFTIDGYEYSVFDDYNGEEKPAVSSQGVSVTTPGKPKEVSFVCRTKPKADYSDLQAVLGNDQD